MPAKKPNNFRPVSFRFDPKLIEQVDQFVEEVQEAVPGITMTRTRAFEVLIRHALKDPPLLPRS